MLLAVGAGLLACLALALSFLEGETQVLQQSAPEHRSEKPPLGRLEVKGMERAEKAQELRDPFTVLHEQAGEAPRRAVGKDRAKEPAGQVSPVGKAKPAAAKAAGPQPAYGLRLQGIAAGAGGRLALLSDGRQTAALAAGESLGAWQVRMVEENRVLVAGPEGEQWLQLAMP